MTIPIALTTLRAPEGASGLVLLGPSLGTAVTPLWGACARLLAGDLTVVGWDLPGHGASDPYDEPFTVQELADAVMEATAAVRAAAAGPITHAGVSLGGAVGLALALDHADAVDGVAVIASGAKIGEPDGWHERAELVRRAGTPVMVDGSAKRWFAPGSIERNPGAATALLSSLQDADRFSYARCCDALARFDVRVELARVRTPVLVVAGEDDQAAPLPWSELVAARAGGTLEVIPGAAHLPPAEQPAVTADALTRFLDGLVARVRAS